MISIVVCARNEEQNITKCISQLAKQDFGGNSIEILVIDNSSIDQTSNLARSALEQFDHLFTNSEVVTIESCSLSASRNFGITATSGEWVIFVDADGYASENWFYNLSKELNDADLVACVVNQIPTLQSYGITNEITNFILSKAHSKKEVIGACMGFKRAIFSQRMFADNLIRGDDTEFVEKLLQSGKRLNYSEGAQYYNHFPNSVKGWLTLAYREGLSRQFINEMNCVVARSRVKLIMHIFSDLCLISIALLFWPFVSIKFFINESSWVYASKEHSLRRSLFWMSVLYPGYFIARRLGRLFYNFTVTEQPKRLEKIGKKIDGC